MAARTCPFFDGACSASRCAHAFARLVTQSPEGCSFCRLCGDQECRQNRAIIRLGIFIGLVRIVYSNPPSESRPSPFTLVTAPSATNSNLHAQEGVFTLAQNISGDASPVDRRSLDEVLGDWIENYKIRSRTGWFYRLTLPKAEADNLCWEIAHQGITQATLFPNFSGVVAAINDMNRWMRPGGPGHATFSS